MGERRRVGADVLGAEPCRRRWLPADLVAGREGVGEIAVDGIGEACAGLVDAEECRRLRRTRWPRSDRRLRRRSEFAAELVLQCHAGSKRVGVAQRVLGRRNTAIPGKAGYARNAFRESVAKPPGNRPTVLVVIFKLPIAGTVSPPELCSLRYQVRSSRSILPCQKPTSPARCLTGPSTPTIGERSVPRPCGDSAAEIVDRGERAIRRMGEPRSDTVICARSAISGISYAAPIGNPARYSPVETSALQSPGLHQRLARVQGPINCTV